jgi:hypothetical protein
MSVETISAYEYSARQAEVLRLNVLYRQCMLDQKYYARLLARYKRWDRLTNITTALVTSTAVGGLTLLKSGWGAIAFSVVGSISALILVVKPFFKPAENIERYSKLHYGFTDMFYQVESLLADIRTADGMTAEHRDQAKILFEAHKSLALQEDAAINQKRVSEIENEVDRAIPGITLWLPSA